MKLIDDAGKAWRLWSVRFSFMGLLTSFLALADWGAVLGVWNMMPGPVRDLLPEQFMQSLSALFFLAAMLARIVKQPKLETPDAAQ